MYFRLTSDEYRSISSKRVVCNSKRTHRIIIRLKLECSAAVFSVLLGKTYVVCPTNAHIAIAITKTFSENLSLFVQYNPDQFCTFHLDNHPNFI